MSDTVTPQIPKSAKTLTIACKLPNGVLLHIDEMVTEYDPRTNAPIKVARRLPETVLVHGCAVPVGTPLPKHQILTGYGLTPGVSADLWEAWLEQNKDSAMVKNRLIFAMPTREGIEAKVEEHKGQRSGLEPLDPSFEVGKNGKIIPNDPRYPVSMNPNLATVHTQEERA